MKRSITALFSLLTIQCSMASSLTFEVSQEYMTSQEKSAPVVFSYDVGFPPEKKVFTIEKQADNKYTLTLPTETVEADFFIKLPIHYLSEVGVYYGQCMKKSDLEFLGKWGKIVVGDPYKYPPDNLLRLSFNTKNIKKNKITTYYESQYWIYYSPINQKVKYDSSCKDGSYSLKIDVNLKKGWNILVDHHQWVYQGNQQKSRSENMVNADPQNIPTAVLFLRKK